MLSWLLGNVLRSLAIVTLVCLAAAALQVFVWLDRLNEAADYAGGVEYLPEKVVEQTIDRMVDAGFGAAPLDPNDPMLSQRKIIVTEGMNERTARYVAERLLHLDRVDPTESIELRLSTSGGWLDSAFAVVDTMRTIDAPVDVVATGGCYSAGTVVLAAATGRRYATPDAVMSIHVNREQPIGEYDDDAHDQRRFNEVYLRHTDVPREWLEALEGDEHYYLDAEQALEMGLIDEVIESRHEAPEGRPREEPRSAA